MRARINQDGVETCRHTELFRRQERLGRLVALGKTSQSPDLIQESATGKNLTTASSWKETPTEELKAVNITLANVDIGGDEEDDR